MRLVDKAWALVVDMAPGGRNGRVFRMRAETALAIGHERGRRTAPVTLFGVPISIDPLMPINEIKLR